MPGKKLRQNRQARTTSSNSGSRHAPGFDDGTDFEFFMSGFFQRQKICDLSAVFGTGEFCQSKLRGQVSSAPLIFEADVNHFPPGGKLFLDHALRRFLRLP
jgi:hypothetical protein